MQKVLDKIIIKNNSIFYYYFKKIVFLVLIPVIIISVFFLYNTYRTSVKIQIDTNNDFYEKKFSEQIFQMEKNIYSLQSVILESQEVSDYFFSNYDNANELSTLVNGVADQLSSICLSSDYIDSIYVYSQKGGYVLSNTGNAVLNNFYDDVIYSYIAGNGVYDNVIYRRLSGKRYLSYVIPTQLYSYPDGVIIFNLDCDKIDRFFINNYVTDIYLLDNIENVVYSSNADYINTKFEKSKNTVMFEPDSLLSLAFEYRESEGFMKSYGAVMAIWFFVLLSIMAISLLVFSNTFSDTLIDLMSMLESSDTKYVWENKLDLKQLIKKVNRKNSVYEKEIISQYNKLKKAQTIILQNQINPHFLFNTLNVITLLDIEKNGGTPTVITKVVRLLSNLLRAAMSSKTYTISLEQEMIFVKQYIELQNIKYNNMISFTSDIPVEVFEISVLKLMLQPIVENCVLHGILKSPTPKQEFIKIEAETKVGNLIINVINSGEMIDAKQLASLNKKLQAGEYPDVKHVGILNVNARIKLIFGEKYGVKVTSENRITTVQIVLPQSDKR